MYTSTASLNQISNCNNVEIPPITYFPNLVNRIYVCVCVRARKMVMCVIIHLE